MSKKIEKATNLIAILKENLETLQEKGIDKAMIISIEKSTKELVKFENEIVLLSEKLEAKIGIKKQKKEDLSQLLKTINNLMKVKASTKKNKKKDKKIEILHPE